MLALTGCATCQQNTVPSGVGMATAGAPAGSTSEAVPAVGFGWETVCIRIPKPKLYAVPKPQTGPSLVGIPILAGAAIAPQMGMPMIAGAPAAPAGQPSLPAGNVDRGSSEPAASTSCTEGCCSSNPSREQVLMQCEELTQQISELSQTIAVKAGNGQGVQVGMESRLH